MAEVKTKLRVITQDGHYFKKNQVVIPNEDEINLKDIDENTVIWCHHTKMSQGLYKSDYEEVKPIEKGDRVITNALCISISEGNKTLPINSPLVISMCLTPSYYKAVDKQGNDYVIHRSEFFAKWDRVKQRESSPFIDKHTPEENNANPVNVGGTIYYIYDEGSGTQLSLRVVWDTNTNNSYEGGHLEHENESELGDKIFPSLTPVEKKSEVKKYRPKAGDIVKISNKSQYFKQEDNPSNPKCKGTIRTTGEVLGMPYGVDWDNGKFNVYEEGDLVVLKKSK